MRRLIWAASLGLSLVFAGGASARDQPGAKAKAEACGDYGTSVHFVASPAEAAKQAQKEEKLVFVLHVSGHFEDPGIT